MAETGIAKTPEQGYYAVIFTSLRTAEDPQGYAEMAAAMSALAATQPGYLGEESARGADGVGITISYWRDEASIAAWKRVAAHAEAQRMGRAKWYTDYAVRVARVERAYDLAESEEAGLESHGA